MSGTWACAVPHLFWPKLRLAQSYLQLVKLDDPIPSAERNTCLSHSLVKDGFYTGISCCAFF